MWHSAKMRLRATFLKNHVPKKETYSILRWHLTLIFIYIPGCRASVFCRWQMLLHAVTRPEFWPWQEGRGGWPEIPKTIPPRHSDNEEPFICLFSIRPSLFCHCSIGPAVAFNRSLPPLIWNNFHFFRWHYLAHSQNKIKTFEKND